jgi:hypothetical protein
MKRIFVVVEGETEERFLRRVVYNHFIVNGIHIEPQQWITNKKIGAKGGGSNFDIVENHIKRVVSRYRNDSSVYISTMIDLYAFPRQGNTIYDEHVSKLTNGKDKVLLLQQMLRDRIAHRNFISYVQFYEYETLLLTNPGAFTTFYTDKIEEIESLKHEIAGLKPEEINESPEGAPSKRIIRHIPKYEKQKTTAGVTIAEKIGLSAIRKACPHFNEWITTLESV